MLDAVLDVAGVWVHCSVSFVSSCQSSHHCEMTVPLFSEGSYPWQSGQTLRRDTMSVLAKGNNLVSRVGCELKDRLLDRSFDSIL